MDYGSGHMLTSLLQSMQLSAKSPQQSSKVLSSCVNTLPRLTNPLNVALLSTQILSAPAIWHVDELSSAASQVFGVFRSASLAKAELERQTVSINDWIEAIVRGADERVPYWKHLIAPAAILHAFARDDARVPGTLRVALETQVCDILNACLTSGDDTHSFTAVLMLCYTADSLSEETKDMINFDALLSATVRMIFLSKQGFQLGEFLEKINADVINQDKWLDWKALSLSHVNLKASIRGPILSHISALSKLAAWAVRRSKKPEAIHDTVEMMLFFAHTLHDFWRKNRLNIVEPGSENEMLTAEARETTTPLMWQLLKLMLFSSITIYQGIISRTLQDRTMVGTKTRVASRVLEALQGMYFISSRMGTQTFATYNFVFYGAIDIVTCDPLEVERLIRRLAGASSDHVAEELVQRYQDLFYLNSLEYLVIVCSPTFSEEFVLPKVTGYLNTGTRLGYREPFEAAHAVVLAIVSTPSTAELCAKILPFYVESVFQQFPNSVSPRQFRLVISTLIKESSPPTPLSAFNYSFPSVILEILHARIEHSSTMPLPPAANEPRPEPTGVIASPTLSERDICILALLDAIPFMEPQTMGTWLDQAGEFLASTPENPNKDILRGRFWDMMSGELDIERAQTAVQWWSEHGRRQVVGLGDEASG